MLPTILRGLEVPNWKKMLEQHEPWMLWVQFLQLYEAVRSGQIMPEQGIQILVQAARQRFMQGQNTPEMIEGRNKEKEKLDKEKEKWKKEAGPEHAGDDRGQEQGEREIGQREGEMEERGAAEEKEEGEEIMPCKGKKGKRKPRTRK
jgi:hypothetical protein